MIENQTEDTDRRDLRRILPGLVVSLIALTIVFYFVDWQDVVAAFKQADYRYLLLALPVYLVAYAARALAWRTLLKEEVSFQRTFLTMSAGYLLNNILPFRLGELGRAFLLGRHGLGFWRVFSTIVIERAFDMILAAGLLLGTLPFVWGAPQSRQVALIVGGGVLIGLAALHLLARYRDWAMAQFEKLGGRWQRVRKFGAERLPAFFDGLSVLVDFWRFLRVLGWMTFGWTLAVVYQYLLLLAFVPDAGLLWAAFGLAVSALGVAVPSSPSYIGVYEAAWIGALALFGVPFSTALAYALVGHVIQVIITGIFGVYALTREGDTLSQVYQGIRKRSFI
ncbi:MAG: flippase-like domain-containing protein [Chloroflexi bacterium]|nr:flippase-like domain-containing protein [Chloroflexota bacterium]